MVVQGGDTVVVEPGRDRAEYRQLIVRRSERHLVSGDLATNVAERVLGATPVELVDGDDVGDRSCCGIASPQTTQRPSAGHVCQVRHPRASGAGAGLRLPHQTVDQSGGCVGPVGRDLDGDIDRPPGHNARAVSQALVPHPVPPVQDP